MPARIPQVGSTYYFRRSVPPRLRPYFLTANGKPRTEFMVSLEVKNLAEAKDLWLVEAIKVAALFREAEAKLKQGIKPDHANAAPKLSGPWNTFPALEDQLRVEEDGRQSAQDELAEELELEADPVKRRVADAVRASLEPQPDSLSPQHKLARRWVPWLCAYTGARVNEMTQLRGQDVQQIEGIWTIPSRQRIIFGRQIFGFDRRLSQPSKFTEGHKGSFMFLEGSRLMGPSSIMTLEGA